MTNPLFDLSGRVAIVTGGNRGCGWGIALGLAAAGAEIVVAARDDERNAATVAEIEALGRRALGVRCDVRSADDIQATLAAALAAFGRVDILVNNAGVAHRYSPERLPEDEWARVLDVNLNGTLRFSQAVHPHFQERGGGKIINLGSMYSLFGTPSIAYGASKGGVIQLTKGLAVAWAPDNIQVNALLPGWITTEMTQPAIDDATFYQRIVDRTPQGRFGEPGELAGAAVFLASPASGFVTGQSLAVDGGYSIA